MSNRGTDQMVDQAIDMSIIVMDALDLDDLNDDINQIVGDAVMQILYVITPDGPQ